MSGGDDDQAIPPPQQQKKRKQGGEDEPQIPPHRRQLPTPPSQQQAPSHPPAPAAAAGAARWRRPASAGARYQRQSHLRRRTAAGTEDGTAERGVSAAASSGAPRTGRRRSTGGDSAAVEARPLSLEQAPLLPPRGDLLAVLERHASDVATVLPVALLGLCAAAAAADWWDLRTQLRSPLVRAALAYYRNRVVMDRAAARAKYSAMKRRFFVYQRKQERCPSTEGPHQERGRGLTPSSERATEDQPRPSKDEGDDEDEDQQRRRRKQLLQQQQQQLQGRNALASDHENCNCATTFPNETHPPRNLRCAGIANPGPSSRRAVPPFEGLSSPPASPSMLPPAVPDSHGYCQEVGSAEEADPSRRTLTRRTDQPRQRQLQHRQHHQWGQQQQRHPSTEEPHQELEQPAPRGGAALAPSSERAADDDDEQPWPPREGQDGDDGATNDSDGGNDGNGRAVNSEMGDGPAPEGADTPHPSSHRLSHVPQNRLDREGGASEELSFTEMGDDDDEDDDNDDDGALGGDRGDEQDTESPAEDDNERKAGPESHSLPRERWDGLVADQAKTLPSHPEGAEARDGPPPDVEADAPFPHLSSPTQHTRHEHQPQRMQERLPPRRHPDYYADPQPAGDDYDGEEDLFSLEDGIPPGSSLPTTITVPPSAADVVDDANSHAAASPALASPSMPDVCASAIRSHEAHATTREGVPLDARVVPDRLAEGRHILGGGFDNRSSQRGASSHQGRLRPDQTASSGTILPPSRPANRVVAAAMASALQSTAASTPRAPGLPGNSTAPGKRAKDADFFATNQAWSSRPFNPYLSRPVDNRQSIHPVEASKVPAARESTPLQQPKSQRVGLNEDAAYADDGDDDDQPHSAGSCPTAASELLLSQFTQPNATKSRRRVTASPHILADMKISPPCTRDPTATTSVPTRTAGRSHSNDARRPDNAKRPAQQPPEAGATGWTSNQKARAFVHETSPAAAKPPPASAPSATGSLRDDRFRGKENCGRMDPAHGGGSMHRPPAATNLATSPNVPPPRGVPPARQAKRGGPMLAPAAPAKADDDQPPWDEDDDGKRNSCDGRPNYRYQEVVRKKAEREGLKPYDCPDCAAFVDMVLLGEGANVFNRDELMCCSRHRGRHTPPATPVDFWELSFIDERDRKLREKLDAVAAACNEDEEI